MIHSAKLNIQLIAQCLLKAGIQDIVISPGSRNAPLMIEFSENPAFQCYSIVDERNAGFFALGLSQQSRKPTVLCCTSGSAVVNYYPAVVEAFYQNIPLLILSADRPENFIDIFDGQTIRQNSVFAAHDIAHFQLSEEESTESITANLQKIKKAIDASKNQQSVAHINIPLSEPLYNTTETELLEIDEIKFTPINFEEIDIQTLKDKWNKAKKKLILVGVLPPEEKLQNILYRFAEDKNAVILSESLSNLSHPNIFNSIDRLVFSMNTEDFQEFSPDILLSIGQNIVSKKIKKLLRDAPIKEHWHLDEYWQPDTYFHLTEKIKQDKTQFLEAFYSEEKPSDFYENWQDLKKIKFLEEDNKLAKMPYSDLKVYEFLQKKLPANTDLYFGNSSAIRYAQLFDFNLNHNNFCNRGTSGIEGSLSSAIGGSFKTQKQSFLIIGDISFFYSANDLWNHYLSEKFKIILINNGGGEIFNFIPGPESITKKEEFLTTKHHRNAKLLCEMFSLPYFYASDFDTLKDIWRFFESSAHTSILEIDTSKVENSRFLKEFLS